MGIDGDEARAREQAATLAALPVDTGAVHVTLFHGFRENPEGASATQLGAVRRARERLESEGFDVTVDEASGDPAEALLELAAAGDADLLVLAGRKRSPAGKALFGSVTQEVILTTDRPVLVCGDAVE